MSAALPHSVGPVVVIGAGLVGTSIGLALRTSGEQVHLVDRSASHAVVAAGLGAGVVDRAEPDEVRLVVVATPPDAIARTVLESLHRYRSAVVTDVGSVKGRILDELRASGADLSRYVGGHPMAGSQHAGPLTAVAELFVDRTWVVSAGPDNQPDDVARVRRMAELCGAQVVAMPAEQHDEAVAQVSHLPQLMSTLTAGHLRQVPGDHLRLAGQGIRDVTRIAASDPQLWRQIISANAEAIRHELEGVRADLDELFAVLDDPQALEEFMARGRSGARLLPGKHGAHPADWVAVVIEIPDTPGALGRLFHDIGAEGVNVEDLSIEHDATREVGYLSVEVSPPFAERLRTAMKAKGWALRA
ncbi:prephenate dehydrogenase [Luteococcus peritonei]|uniref:Prephenate dehydrogenase n=1 Tax=Luteococcus peritonei TaxID=88874 RepID=A0ABW4RVM9_9ACTN